MTEPVFFDCLTDTQIWCLFEMGVLQDYRLPVEVYQRLQRIALEHGAYLFTWPAGLDLPVLQELVPGIAVPGEESPVLTHSHVLDTHAAMEHMRAAIEAFCARVHADRSLAGARIYLMVAIPHPLLRAGPYLEAQSRDLTAMSLPELEAYLDNVLRVD